jgi:CBS domain-containing protein
VYDYTLGKVEWMAAGLPTVRAEPGKERRAIDVANTDPPTCGPDENVKDVADRAQQGGWRTVIVLNELRVVIGRLGPDELADAVPGPVDNALQPGPPTVRAHEPLDALLERMREKSIADMIVSTPEGVLLGLVTAADVARVSEGS